MHRLLATDGVARSDARGCPVSGASLGALAAYESALATFQTWRVGAEALLDQAMQQAPAFVMAHVLQAHLRICSRDPHRVRSAAALLARAAALQANACEQLHLAAIAAVLADDYELAQDRLAEVLRRQPRDVLALQVAHAFDYLGGDVARLRGRVAAVLPAWSADMPGYGTVLAMHAFGLEECGAYAAAEATAREALALNPLDARAHHVMAHVFEMTGRAEEGLHWMSEHAAGWELDSTVAGHCRWHMALFHLARGRHDRALALYDRHVHPGRSGDVADLIDAAALLWRLWLQGGDAGPRWAEAAEAWAPHIDDAFCSFNDLHAMMAFVGAQDWVRARRLEQVLVQARSRPTRHGAMTRQFGLDACRALCAYGRMDDRLTIALLSGLPAQVQRIGGSHAQRDVLQLTLRGAVSRLHARHGGARAARAGDAEPGSGLRSRGRGYACASRPPAAPAASASTR